MHSTHPRFFTLNTLYPTIWYSAEMSFNIESLLHLDAVRPPMLPSHVHASTARNSLRLVNLSHMTTHHSRPVLTQPAQVNTIDSRCIYTWKYSYLRWYLTFPQWSMRWTGVLPFIRSCLWSRPRHCSPIRVTLIFIAQRRSRLQSSCYRTSFTRPLLRQIISTIRRAIMKQKVNFFLTKNVNKIIKHHKI